MSPTAGVPAARPALVRRTVTAAALSTVVGSLPVFLVGGLALLIRDDLQFGALQLGIAVSTFFGVAAVTAVPAGRIAALVGAWTSTVLAAALSASALVALALASSYPFLLAALAVAGMANALAQIGTNQALAQVVPADRQGFAFGVKQSAVPASTLLAGLAVPLVGLTLGWRASFFAGVLLAIGYVLVAPRPQGQRAAPRLNVDRSGGVAVRALAVVAVAGAFGAGAASALGAFLVDSAVADGMSPSAAGLLLAAGSAVGVVIRLLVGWGADRRARGLLLLVAGMLGGGALGMALLATSSVTALVPGTALAFGLGWSWPGLLTFAVVRLNPTAPAVASSITQTGQFAGSAAGPLLFGLLVEVSSYRVAWSAAAVALLAAAVLMVLGRHMMLADRARPSMRRG